MLQLGPSPQQEEVTSLWRRHILATAPLLLCTRLTTLATQVLTPNQGKPRLPIQSCVV